MKKKYIECEFCGSKRYLTVDELSEKDTFYTSFIVVDGKLCCSTLCLVNSTDQFNFDIKKHNMFIKTCNKGADYER
ncbi:MAG: hypothetical protein ACRC4W_08580 [Treponemataceae bacterium]